MRRGILIAAGLTACHGSSTETVVKPSAPPTAALGASASASATSPPVLASAIAAPVGGSASVAAEQQAPPVASQQPAAPSAVGPTSLALTEPALAGLLQAALGGVRADPSPLDHGPGKPLLGVCELKLVNWKSNPIVFGLEQFAQVADAEEAKRVRVRSYAIRPAQFVDMNKDGTADLAIVPVLQFAPDGATGIKQWSEIHFFAARNCKIGSVVVVKSGRKP